MVVRQRNAAAAVPAAVAARAAEVSKRTSSIRAPTSLCATMQCRAAQVEGGDTFTTHGGVHPRGFDASAHLSGAPCHDA